MATIIPSMTPQQAMLLPQKGEQAQKTTAASVPFQAADQTGFSVKNNPPELILQAAMEKINEMFAPHLGDGAVESAVASGQDMSPEATAERILSFATRIIGRAEADQADLSPDEQSSREQLFNNIQTGVERGFEQARGILEGLQTLNGETKETVDATYAHVQSGLSELAQLLDLDLPEQSVV